jgi:hypothetical protein
MKKKLIIIFIITNIFYTNKIYSQNKTAETAAVVGAAVVEGLLIANSINLIQESLERNMSEWIFKNYKFNEKTQFELKMLDWEASKKADLSGVSVISFSFKIKDKPTIIFLMTLSPGWYGDNGINVTYINYYEIDKSLWDKIIITYLNLSKTNLIENEFDLTSIPTINPKDRSGILFDIKDIYNITANHIEFYNNIDKYSNFEFLKLDNGDTHIVKDFDSNFLLDFNEGNLNIFLKKSNDLIRLRRQSVLNISKILFNNKYK